MQKLVDACGFYVMLLGGLVVLIGLLSLGRSLYGLGWDPYPFAVIGTGVGVFLWGVFFSALAEIIRRLPAPAEKTKKCSDCAETVDISAKKCSYCGKSFVGARVEDLV